MKIIKLNLDQDLRDSDISLMLRHDKNQELEIERSVDRIISEVRLDGDEALIKLSNKFDQSNFAAPADLKFDTDKINNCEELLSGDQKSSLETAFNRIRSYHLKQLPKDFQYLDDIGCNLGNYWRSIEKVGIYAPGGTASYPSSVLMSAVPALIAGVKDIALTVPTSKGKISPAILYAAKLCGIRNIYKIGGAQAIAALTYGTKVVSKVDKIVGPGNSYVAYAKKRLYGEVGIDMIAGPTDLTIIAQKNLIKASWVAADTLSQLEHGPDSKAFVVVDDEDFAKQIIDEIGNLSKSLSRKKIISKSLKNSAIILIKDIVHSAKVINFIAPEHLQIISEDSQEIVKEVKNAGAIFVGKYTPEALGDYVAGPSHTLPTMQSAKFSSGLSVYDFLKRISYISCDWKSFSELSQATATLADLEGLDAHKLTIDIRNKS